MSSTRRSKSTPLSSAPRISSEAPKTPSKRCSFSLEQLVEPRVGGVLPVEEVQHQHVALLAVAVAAADALLDALRVPGQVVVHHQVAELEVQPLGAGLGREEDLRAVAELLHQRLPLLGRAGVAGEQRDRPAQPCAASSSRRYSCVRRDSVKITAFSGHWCARATVKTRSSARVERLALGVDADGLGAARRRRAARRPRPRARPSAGRGAGGPAASRPLLGLLGESLASSGSKRRPAPGRARASPRRCAARGSSASRRSVGARAKDEEARSFR